MGKIIDWIEGSRVGFVIGLIKIITAVYLLFNINDVGVLITTILVIHYLFDSILQILQLYSRRLKTKMDKLKAEINE